MSKQLGNVEAGSTINFKWNTTDGTGASASRTVAGTVKVYKDDGVTSSSTGLTDTPNHNGIVGSHHCKVDLSVDTFFSAGADYQVVVEGMDIGGVVINATLAEFSIEKRWENTLNDVSLSEIMGYSVDGSITTSEALKRINAYASGKVNRSGSSYTYRNNADTADVFTNESAASTRSPA